jgi:hypothetical protein
LIYRLLRVPDLFLKFQVGNFSSFSSFTLWYTTDKTSPGNTYIWKVQPSHLDLLPDLEQVWTRWYFWTKSWAGIHYIGMKLSLFLYSLYNPRSTGTLQERWTKNPLVILMQLNSAFVRILWIQTKAQLKKLPLDNYWKNKWACKITKSQMRISTIGQQYNSLIKRGNGTFSHFQTWLFLELKYTFWNPSPKISFDFLSRWKQSNLTFLSSRVIGLL